MRKQKKTNHDELTPSKGLLGFFHKTVMFLLWPLRKPYIAIPLLILMYLIPTFIGARPTEVHIWYWNKIKGWFSPVSEQIVSKSKELAQSANFTIPNMSELKEKIIPSSEPAKTVQSGDDYTKEQEIRRQIFEKAKNAEAPLSIDIMSQQNQPQAPKFVEEPRQNQETAPRENSGDIDQDETSEPTISPNIAKAKEQNLDLIYLDTPQEISGEAYVVSANEIVIGNNDIFLFGIYVDPNSREGVVGKEFLQNFIGNDPVNCTIEAYTKQGIATGMCYVRKISINHTLVNNGISQNVAL